VNKKRPVNLELSTIHFPITAIVSILHRASGVFLFAGMAVLLWLLDASLESAEGFAAVQDTFANPLCQFIVWAVVAALAYHTTMGLRHLLMDFGLGESLKGGQLGAQLAFVIAVILIVLAGVWILW
jgi:succinate dehydrogenase / fumarate reductase cytochrome b subunit